MKSIPVREKETRQNRRPLCYKGGRRAALFVSRNVKDQRMQDEKLPTVTESAMRGIACKCPRCGEGRLYSGFLTLRPTCEACGLDYAFIDAGDGPAIFIIMIAGAIVVGCALIVEVKYQPPFWLHAVLWLPLILATTLLPLRAMKSLLISLQFHHKAAEGRLIDRAPK
jgi:uncharacterized protein (DUF983 family)